MQIQCTPPTTLNDTCVVRRLYFSKKDKTIELIGERVEDLGGIAKQMNEELQVQSKMIDELDQAVEKAQEHVSNINAQVADTLKKVRDSDKLCIDILCLLLLLGLIGVMIQLARS